jgi:hypothetical protein
VEIGMHIWLDALVTTADGATPGRVSRLLVHPASWKVLSIAVQRGGWLRREEVAVPLDEVKSTSAAGVQLRLDRAAFQRLPRVPAADWRRPPREWLTPLGWRSSRVFWPAGYDGPVYPGISAGQLRGWGTLRADGWATPRLGTSPTGGSPAARSGPTHAPAGDRAPELAANRIQVELERELRGESLLDVDPYDVLARPSECGFKTVFEWDDASDINPQPRPDV